MTTEKMTVHKALCELKTLDSRIQKCMQQNPFVFANKHANSKVAGVSVGDYCKEVQASYQSANDLIARRDAIKRAVTLSNATVKVTIGGKEYTVAEAIELKNHGVPLKQMLLKKLDSDNRRARMEADKNNGDVLELRADEYIAQLGEHLLCTQRVAGSSPTISTNRQATCRVTLEDWSNKVKQSLQDVFRYQNTTGTEQKCLGSVTPCGIRGRR